MNLLLLNYLAFKIKNLKILKIILMLFTKVKYFIQRKILIQMAIVMSLIQRQTLEKILESINNFNEFLKRLKNTIKNLMILRLISILEAIRLRKKN